MIGVLDHAIGYVDGLALTPALTIEHGAKTTINYNAFNDIANPPLTLHGWGLWYTDNAYKFGSNNLSLTVLTNDSGGISSATVRAGDTTTGYSVGEQILVGGGYAHTMQFASLNGIVEVTAVSDDGLGSIVNLGVIQTGQNYTDHANYWCKYAQKVYFRPPFNEAVYQTTSIPPTGTGPTLHYNTLNVTAPSGNFVLDWNSTPVTIAYDASAATIQSALQSAAGIFTVAVNQTGSGTYRIYSGPNTLTPVSGATVSSQTTNWIPTDVQNNLYINNSNAQNTLQYDYWTIENMGFRNGDMFFRLDCQDRHASPCGLSLTIQNCDCQNGSGQGLESSTGASPVPNYNLTFQNNYLNNCGPQSQFSSIIGPALVITNNGSLSSATLMIWHGKPNSYGLPQEIYVRVVTNGTNVYNFTYSATSTLGSLISDINTISGLTAAYYGKAFPLSQYMSPTTNTLINGTGNINDISATSSTLIYSLLDTSFLSNAGQGTGGTFSLDLLNVPLQINSQDNTYDMFTLVNGGTNYTVGDRLTVSGSTPGTLTVSSISGNGTTGPITSLTVGTSGACTTGNSYPSGGTGSNCEINIIPSFWYLFAIDYIGLYATWQFNEHNHGLYYEGGTDDNTLITNNYFGDFQGKSGNPRSGGSVTYSNNIFNNTLGDGFAVGNYSTAGCTVQNNIIISNKTSNSAFYGAQTYGGSFGAYGQLLNATITNNTIFGWGAAFGATYPGIDNCTTEHNIFCEKFLPTEPNPWTLNPGNGTYDVSTSTFDYNQWWQASSDNNVPIQPNIIIYDINGHNATGGITGSTPAASWANYFALAYNWGWDHHSVNADPTLDQNYIPQNNVVSGGANFGFVTNGGMVTLASYNLLKTIKFILRDGDTASLVANGVTYTVANTSGDLTIGGEGLSEGQSLNVGNYSANYTSSAANSFELLFGINAKFSATTILAGTTINPTSIATTSVAPPSIINVRIVVTTFEAMTTEIAPSIGAKIVVNTITATTMGETPNITTISVITTEECQQGYICNTTGPTQCVKMKNIVGNARTAYVPAITICQTPYFKWLVNP